MAHRERSAPLLFFLAGTTPPRVTSGAPLHGAPLVSLAYQWRTGSGVRHCYYFGLWPPLPGLPVAHQNYSAPLVTYLVVAHHILVRHCYIAVAHQSHSAPLVGILGIAIFLVVPSGLVMNLNKCYLVPALSMNIISGSCLLRDGYPFKSRE